MSFRTQPPHHAPTRAVHLHERPSTSSQRASCGRAAAPATGMFGLRRSGDAAALGGCIGRQRRATVAHARRGPKKGGGGGASQVSGEVEFLALDPEGYDNWRLEEIATLIARGGVGVIPTDTFYAFVCDVHNTNAVEKLYRIKDINPAKPLSLICRDFSDIGVYTNGFPRGGPTGCPNSFRIARKCLPGPYTFILPASKELPKRCFEVKGKKECKFRTSVGVRIPDDPICQGLLSILKAPLLCSSVPVEKGTAMQVEPANIADIYGNLGLDFVVDGGVRIIDSSTVIDLSTTGYPIVLREGKGDTSIWEFELPNEYEPPQKLVNAFS